MKFQIVFLSLFLAAAHARHEPKGKGLRGGDDRDLELVGSTVVPNGSSATINCGSGIQCCVTGTFKTINNVGSKTSSCQGSTLSNGSLGNCQSNSCSVSCDGVCNVVVKAGSGSAGDGGDGGYDNDGDYGYDNDDDGDGDNDDGDGDGDGGDNDGGNGK